MKNFDYDDLPELETDLAMAGSGASVVPAIIAAVVAIVVANSY